MTVANATASFFLCQALLALFLFVFMVCVGHAAMGTPGAWAGAVFATIFAIALQIPLHQANDFAHPLTVNNAGTVQTTTPQIDDPRDGPNTLITTSTGRYLVAGLPSLTKRTPLNLFTYRSQPDHLCSATACYSILAPP